MLTLLYYLLCYTLGLATTVPTHLDSMRCARATHLPMRGQPPLPSPTPIPRAGCRGQRQPLPAHLVDEAVTAATACPAPVHSGCKLCHESVRIPCGLRSEITESTESDLLHDRTSHDSIQTNSVMAQYDYGSVCHPYRRAGRGGRRAPACSTRDYRYTSAWNTYGLNDAGRAAERFSRARGA
eukprot:COSAG02_NODE_461_length_21848_cov_235.681043_14_plen_182_part_00